MNLKFTTLLLATLTLTVLGAAESLEDTELNQTYEAENEEIIENAFIQEDTVDLEEALGEVPRVVRTIAPAQRINIDIDSEEQNEEFSISMNSNYTQLSMNQSHTDNPTLEVRIKPETVQEEQLNVDELVKSVEKGEIEMTGHTWFNRIMVFAAERILF